MHCVQALANGDRETCACVLDSASAAITKRIAGVATESASSISQAVVQLQMLQLLGQASAGMSDVVMQPPQGEQAPSSPSLSARCDLGGVLMRMHCEISVRSRAWHMPDKARSGRMFTLHFQVLVGIWPLLFVLQGGKIYRCV